jgi:hypothetical protein
MEVTVAAEVLGEALNLRLGEAVTQYVAGAEQSLTLVK